MFCNRFCGFIIAFIEVQNLGMHTFMCVVLDTEWEKLLIFLFEALIEREKNEFGIELVFDKCKTPTCFDMSQVSRVLT